MQAIDAGWDKADFLQHLIILLLRLLSSRRGDSKCDACQDRCLEVTLPTVFVYEILASLENKPSMHWKASYSFSKRLPVGYVQKMRVWLLKILSFVLNLVFISAFEISWRHTLFISQSSICLKSTTVPKDIILRSFQRLRFEWDFINPAWKKVLC